LFLFPDCLKLGDTVHRFFQYGSNCSEMQINANDRLRGDAKFVGIAETAEEFELAFNVYSMGRGCAASDIVRKPGGKVWGVLYEVPDHLISRDSASAHGRKSFDAIEGEGTNYKREAIQVCRRDGQALTAITYRVRAPQAGLRTSIDYVRHVVTGLREHDIPEEYVGKVKAIASENNPDIASVISAL
jgi:gamma-glutamylcyclotransferase (GGCT)/AIG2-like uncharacterized protein YtfP